MDGEGIEGGDGSQIACRDDGDMGMDSQAVGDGTLADGCERDKSQRATRKSCNTSIVILVKTDRFFSRTLASFGLGKNPLRKAVAVSHRAANRILTESQAENC